MSSQKPTPKDEDAPETDALSERQERALRALLTEPTTKAAAAACGVSETTLWRYKKDEAFLRRYDEAKSEALDHAVTCVQLAAVEAVAVLIEEMRRADSPPGARISAAQTVFSLGFKTAEVDQLRREVADLTAAIVKRLEAQRLHDVWRATKENEKPGLGN